MPRSFRENKLDQLRYERTARQAMAKEQARRKLEGSSLPPRMAHHERQRLKAAQSEAADAAAAAAAAGGGGAPAQAGRRQLGCVPDFERLQREFEEKLMRSKNTNRGKLTVPQEFILNGRDKEAQVQRRLKATERRQKVLQQIEQDAMNMREQRWPYVARRSDGAHRKRGGAPSSSSRPSSASAAGYHETRSSLSRRELVLDKIRSGAYDARDVREEKEARRRHEECHERANAWMRAQARSAGGAPAPAGVPGAGEADMERGPMMHAAARHKQIEEGVRNLVETTLLENDIYREHKRFVVDEQDGDGGDDAYQRQRDEEAMQIAAAVAAASGGEEHDGGDACGGVPGGVQDVLSTAAAAGSDAGAGDARDGGLAAASDDAEANFAEASRLAGAFTY